MTNAGDKFIIEIDSVFGGKNGEKLYRVKGFNSLVFDDYGLEKLTVYKEPEKATEPERGMVYENKEIENCRVVVTQVDRDEHYDEVHYLECSTGAVHRSALTFFLMNYKNTGENVSSYLEVVLGNLPF